MKLIISIFLLFSTLNLNAQKIENNDNCIINKVENIEENRVKVTTYNKCKNITTIRTYTKKEWRKTMSKNKKLKN